MFESLTESIQGAIKTLRGKGKLTESNMRDALGLVEQSLLEADVSYPVVRDFMDRVSQKALGRRVLLSLDPGEQVIGFVRDELIEILGPVDTSLHLQKDVNVLMMCGLQGAGKTTTCGKLAQLLINGGAQPMLVAADLQRPAAIAQLHVLGERLGIPVYSEEGAKDPVAVCQAAVRKAPELGASVVILDTAGRLAIDEALMKQLVDIDKRVKPDQVYLVVDGMTGQDAVNSAKAFNEALELNGVIMTKLDGDARGGALLSVKHVTGVPIKFMGTGEHLDALEPFRPEGMAQRILGMTDVLGLVDLAEQVVSKKQQEELEKKLLAKQFTLDDFRDQLMSMAKPGLIQKMLGAFGGPMADMSKMMDEDTTKDIVRQAGIINSMTPDERRNTSLIDPSRRQRIAKGAGVQANEVGQLIKQYDQMKPVMEGMAGKGMGERMKLLQDMQSGAMFGADGQMAKVKQSTGKRKSKEQKKNDRRSREKLLRQKKRQRRGR